MIILNYKLGIFLECGDWSGAEDSPSSARNSDSDLSSDSDGSAPSFGSDFKNSDSD